ncbi:isoprenylcysteine carboxylmethyltransferase family protein [Fodinibius sp. Rm-B-1B1-1]|uniref:methyltransferase family protein n=1 Tax=Fodinibius alkaliphilus TaxID=3140241 RepID=UPI00315A2813
MSDETHLNLLEMNLALKIPPAVLTLIIAGAMWWIDENMNHSWIEFGPLYWAASISLALGGIFGVLGLVQFYQHSTSIDPHKPDKVSSLVTNGIYSVSRNPMYVALLLVLAAYGFYLGNGLTLALLPVFVGYMNRFQIEPEEKVMQEKFGEEFLHYKRDVRRWL